MKVYNRMTGRGIEANRSLYIKDRDGNRWAVYHSKHGFKAIHVPVLGDDVPVGKTYMTEYRVNSRGHITHEIHKLKEKA